MESPTTEGTERPVRRLKESKTFETVDYVGYAQTEKTTRTVGADEKAVESVKGNTERNTDTKTDTESVVQQPLSLLNKTNETSIQADKQTAIIHSATILCKLK